MRRVYPKVFRESDESAVNRKMHNPSLKARYRTRKGTFEVFLAAGSRDDVTFFRERSYLMALSVNWRMGYCGLQVWDMSQIDWERYREDPSEDPEIDVEDVFHQNATEALSTEDWDNWEPWYLAQCLFRDTKIGHEVTMQRLHKRLSKKGR